MRWRLIVLAVLGVLLALGTVGLAYAAAQLQYQGQVLGSSGELSPAELANERSLFVTSFALQTMIAPLALSTVLALAAILAVLARGRQLRRRVLAR